MENILHIQTITKQEFISIIKDVIEEKLTKDKNSSEPKNLTIKEVASTLNVSELTVYNYIKRGVLPANKIGRKYIIRKEDLESALKEVKSLKYRR